MWKGIPVNGSLTQSLLKMATSKIRADNNFINPYPHAKIRIRARARNPQRVENDTRTRYPRISVCPRITHMPARTSKTCRTKTPALAASAAGLPESGLGAGVAQPSSAAVVGPGCGRRSPQAWGPGHRRRGAWARPARALGCGVEPHRRGGLGTAVSCRRRGCLGEEERRPMGGDSGSHEGAEGDWATTDWGWRPRGVEVERSGGNE